MGKKREATEIEIPVLEERKGLVKEWDKVLGPIREVHQEKKGREISLWNEAQIAQCLQNLKELLIAKKQGLSMFEDTYTSDVVSLSKFGFPVIAAALPSLASLDVLSLQAMDRKNGAVYHLDYQYDTTKSGVTSGGAMLAAKTGPNYQYRFTQNHDSYAIGTGDGAETNFTATGASILRFIPVIASSVTITAVSGSSTLTVTDDGSGNLVGDIGSGNNSIDYTTGAVDVTFSSAPDVGVSVTISYRFNWESNRNNIPKMKINIASTSVVAEMRALVATWFLAAAYDLAKAHNIKIEELLASGVAGEVRHEIDVENFQFVYDIAFGANAAGTVTFNAGSATYYSLIEKYQEIVKVFTAASNLITSATGRGTGNVIVAGLNVCNVLESCGPDFMRFEIDYSKGAPNGPHRVGVFGGRWIVIKNPAYNTNKAVIAYKGQDWLDAGAVYAPYQPLLIVGPHVLADDLGGRIGCISQDARVETNGAFFAGFTLTNFS